MNRSKFDRQEAFMSDVQSLNHSKWECKYHMTWIPKCRKKILYGGLRKYLGGVFTFRWLMNLTALSGSQVKPPALLEVMTSGFTLTLQRPVGFRDNAPRVKP
jgi:hypothetical protein